MCQVSGMFNRTQLSSKCYYELNAYSHSPGTSALVVDYDQCLKRLSQSSAPVN